jgi:lipopolysaccharide export system protein LptC
VSSQRNDPRIRESNRRQLGLHVNAGAAGLRGSWRDRQRPVAGSTQGYTQFVRIMKITLPLVAFSLIVLVVLYSAFGRDSQNFKITMEQRAGGADDRQLVAPKLTGTDGKGQPFTVTAKAATQAPGKSQRMNFESVVGDITLQDKSWLALEATRGMMDGDAKTLDLYDTINIFTDKGYECHTNSARYDFGAGVLQGQHDINCQGPLGIITAKAFEGLKDPGRMTFLGGVQTTIYPAPRDDAAKREAADPNSDGNAAPQSDAPIAPAPATTPAPAQAAGTTPPAPTPGSAATPAPPASPPLPRQKPTLP